MSQLQQSMFYIPDPLCGRLYQNQNENITAIALDEDLDQTSQPEGSEDECFPLPHESFPVLRSWNK